MMQQLRMQLQTMGRELEGLQGRERQQAERALWSASEIVRLFKFEFAFVLLSET